MTDPVWCEGHLVDPARPEWGYLGRGWRVDVAVPSAGDGTRAVLTFDPGHEDQTHRPAVKRGDTLAIKAMLTLYEQEYWSGITKDTPVLTVYRDKDYRVEASEHDS
jgi:hypothetical protein